MNTGLIINLATGNSSNKMEDKTRCYILLHEVSQYDEL